MPDFLLEIGTEEIPARMIQDAGRMTWAIGLPSCLVESRLDPGMMSVHPSLCNPTPARSNC